MSSGNADSALTVLLQESSRGKRLKKEKFIEATLQEKYFTLLSGLLYTTGSGCTSTMVDAVWHAAEYCDSSPVGVHDDFVMGGKSTIEVLVQVCFKWCSHKGLDPSKIISSHVAPLSMRVINSFQIVGAACLARIALRVPSAGPDLLSATFGTIFGVCVKPGATSENDAFILQHAVDASMCCFMLELINAVSGGTEGALGSSRDQIPHWVARAHSIPGHLAQRFLLGVAPLAQYDAPFRSSLLIALRKLLSTTLMGNDSSPSLLAAILRCLCLLFDNMSDMREEIAMMVGQIFTKGSELLVITTCREVSVLLRAYADANPADIDEGIVDGVAALRRELLSRIRKRVSLAGVPDNQKSRRKSKGRAKASAGGELQLPTIDLNPWKSAPERRPSNELGPLLYSCALAAKICYVDPHDAYLSTLTRSSLLASDILSAILGAVDRTCASSKDHGDNMSASEDTGEDEEETILGEEQTQGISKIRRRAPRAPYAPNFIACF